MCAWDETAGRPTLVWLQRRSQVSLAGGGGLTEFQGGGINLNTYSYGKKDNAAWGAQIFPGGAEPPSPPPPPVATGLPRHKIVGLSYQWRIQGGGPAPPFGPRSRLFNIGPKVDPPLFCL